MPVVPRRAPGYVPTEPRPIVRPPTGAFQPAPPVDLSPVIKVADRILQEEQQKADHAAILDADTKLTELSNQLLYDPNTGALARRGEDAAPAHKDAIAVWAKRTSELEASLSENQKLAFRRVAQGRTEDFDRVLSQHASTEIQRSIREKATANLEAERTATLQSYTDLTRVQLGIEHQRNALTLAGDLLGEAPEITKQKIAEEVSRIHTGVIALTLADHRDLDADAYFKAHASELEPAQLLEIKQQVDRGSLLGESQRRSDSIVASSPTLLGALAEAKKLLDPQLRQEAERLIRRSFEDRAADDRLLREQAFQRAGQVLEQTRDLNRIPPADWLALSVDDRAALTQRENVLRHPKRVTNPDLYGSLMNMAGISDASRAQFQELNLSQYQDQLSEVDYQRLLRIQFSGRRSTAGAVAGEAKRQAAAAEKDAKKEAARAQARELLRSMGVDVPPAVPGGPLRTPGSPPPNFDGSVGGSSADTTKGGKPVPKAWRDHAARDPNYKLYLQHMGVKF